MTPEQASQMRLQQEIEYRNRFLSDEELDTLFPEEGYEIVKPPANYRPIHTPQRRLLATPTPLAQTPAGFQIPTEAAHGEQYGVATDENGLIVKPEDYEVHCLSVCVCVCFCIAL